MTTVHRIKIKLPNGAEFEAEGTEKTVQSQYDQFLEMAKGAPSNAANSIKRNDKPPSGDFDQSLLSKIFEIRPDGLVTLRVLPKGEDRNADALLLILLGFRRLKDIEQVLATHLLRAAAQSGINVYRPAQALANYEQPYLIRGGQKKGSTYALNNQGIAKAEEIAAQIFQ